MKNAFILSLLLVSSFAVSMPPIGNDKNNKIIIVPEEKVKTKGSKSDCPPTSFSENEMMEDDFISTAQDEIDDSVLDFVF